ncbi:MAG: 23S rRNA (guanosine(2251)-2'-O)-methyltransferase RlmB [Synechococcus sp.]|nr:23S rRNA (guanosine(2251)-2'-O)-methyltransferase RlmB [Synechococcus sp.]
MSPRPDRRPDSRPERAARRPAGGPPGRGAGRSPGRSAGSSFRPASGRRPRWETSQGEGDGAGPGDRPRREIPPPQGEWTPRPRPGGGGAEVRRPAGSRWEGRPADGGRTAPRRSDSRADSRPDFRADNRPDNRADFRGDNRPPGRFERPPEGRPGPERREEGDRFAARRRPSSPSRSGPGGRRGWEPRPAAARGSARPVLRAPLPAGLRRRDDEEARPTQEIPQGDHFAAAAPSDLIWGRHAAQASLESGRPIHRVWCTPEMRFSPRFLTLLREAKAGGVLVEEVSWARLGQISGGAVHQGIVLQPAAAETLDLPSLIEGCRGIGEPPLLIAVDGLTDPQNLGAIVRSAEALGAHGMVLPQRRNAGLTGSVAKVAAGALEHLPVARVVNLNRSLEALRQEGYRVIGLAAEGNLTLEEADLEGPLVVVTGSEGEGLSLLTRRSCDQLVRIPLRGTTPSLNAGVATALLLYEVARRSWMQGLRGTSPAPRLQRPALPSAPAELPSPDADAAELAPEPPAGAGFRASGAGAADPGTAGLSAGAAALLRAAASEIAATAPDAGEAPDAAAPADPAAWADPQSGPAADLPAGSSPPVETPVEALLEAEVRGDEVRGDGDTGNGAEAWNQAVALRPAEIDAAAEPAAGAAAIRAGGLDPAASVWAAATAGGSSPGASGSEGSYSPEAIATAQPSAPAAAGGDRAAAAPDGLAVGDRPAGPEPGGPAGAGQVDLGSAAGQDPEVTAAGMAAAAPFASDIRL